MSKEALLWAVGETSVGTVSEALKDKLNVKQLIKDTLANDSEDESEKTLTLYALATAEQRAVMDALLVCMCGETMESLIYSTK